MDRRIKSGDDASLGANPGLTPAERRGVQRDAKQISKKRTNSAGPDGTLPKAADPPEPGARDDAAAHAGDQAAATLQSRPHRLRGERARAQSAAGTQQRER